MRTRHSYALFSARFRPLTGGVESYTESIATALARQGDRVVVVTSRTGDEPARERDAAGFEIVRLPAYPLMDARLPVPRHAPAYRALIDALRRRDIDRFLINNRFYPHSLAGLELARELGVPAVVLDHGSAYLVLEGALANAALRVWEHATTGVCKRYRPTFAGVSAASAAWLKTFSITCDHVIPNAIDAPALRGLSSGRAFRNELGIADGQVLVAFVGRLAPDKGALTLARAAGMVGDRLAVAFAGEGPERAQIERLGNANTHLLGMVSRPDLSALLSAADLFCLPTRSEGFWTALLEAAAWGVTPLMPPVGGVDEVMGAPVRFGHLLPSTEVEVVAKTVSAALSAGSYGKLPALREHVETACTWESSVRALEACYAPDACS